MLDKATMIDRFVEMQTNFFCHVGGRGEMLPTSIWRKIFWYFALTETGCQELFNRLKDICPFPKKRIGKVRSVYDVIPRSLRAEKESGLWDTEDLCCRSEYLSDAFISDFKGKYWDVSAWESTGLFSSDAEFESYFFEEFFKKYPDRVKTKENYPEFLGHMDDFLQGFLPSFCTSKILKYLEKHDEYFIERDEEGTEKYVQDFSNDVLEQVISFLRFEYDEESKQTAVSIMRTIYDFPEKISEEEIHHIVKALFDQPLMVNFNDACYCGIIDYVVFKSFSLGFLLTQKQDYQFRGYDNELCKELEDFYKKFDEFQEPIFPYLKYSACDIDVYYSENIYVAGCYPELGEYYGREENVTLTVPSLPDIVLLQWADELYDKCHKEGE